MADWTADRPDWLPDPPRENGTADAAADRQPRPIAGDYLCIRWVTNNCPHCGWPRSRTERVQRTRTSVYRYHTCSRCRQRFKSVETIHPRK